MDGGSEGRYNSVHLECLQDKAKYAQELISYAQENIAKFDDRYELLMKENGAFADVKTAYDLINYQMRLLWDVIYGKLGLYTMYWEVSRFAEFPEDIHIPDRETTLQQVEETASTIHEVASRSATYALENNEPDLESATTFAAAVSIIADRHLVDTIATLMNNNMYSDTLWAKHKYLFATYVADKCDDPGDYRAISEKYDFSDITGDAMIENTCRKDRMLEIRKSYRSDEVDQDAAFAAYIEIAASHNQNILIGEAMGGHLPWECASLLKEAYVYSSPFVTDAVSFCYDSFEKYPNYLYEDIYDRKYDAKASKAIYQAACFERGALSGCDNPDLREYLKHHLGLEEDNDFTNLEANFYPDEV